MTDVQYIGLFTTLLTTAFTALFTLLLKHTDSKQAKRDREYEQSVVRREKYEQLLIAFLTYRNRMTYLLNSNDPHDFEPNEEQAKLQSDIGVMTDIYFPEMSLAFMELTNFELFMRYQLRDIAAKYQTINNLPVANNAIRENKQFLVDDWRNMFNEFGKVIIKDREKYRNINI